MADPYQTLGVVRGDSEEKIRAAYHKLAKRFHPDLNAGRPEAAERFKTIGSAYDLLSDADKRARFDRGEIDADGRETAAGRGRGWQHQPGGGMNGGFSTDDLDTLFGHGFAGDRFGGAGRGRDMHYPVTVTFREAARGTVRRVLLPDGRELDVTIPAGSRHGHVLRLKGQGRRGPNGAGGDALVEITVAPDRLFRREGDDVVMDLPISLQEAVLGATIEVPTLRGQVRLTIPPGSGSGARLRLKGRGIGVGHQYVVLKPVLPPGSEPALAEFLAGWTPAYPFDPRAGLDDD
jgi:DnaJ-class molecular chaperone